MAVRLLRILVTGALVSSCAVEAASPDDPYRARLADIRAQRFPQTIVITDRAGQLLAEVAPNGYRTWVPLAEMAPDLRVAVVATEDQTFFSNSGVDPSAVARAALQNAQAGETVSGASTITMQLVRLVAMDEEERYEQTMERKILEAQLASELAAQLSKDEILEAFLNLAYFGHQAYGAEAAARIYFGTSVSHLSLGEAALLAGLPQAPAVLDPYQNPDGALARRRIVLDRMVEVEVITKETADAAAAEPLVLAGFHPEQRRARHFVDYVLDRLPEAVGSEAAARGGFTVTTTLDLALDDALRGIAQTHVNQLRDAHDVTDAAVVAMRPGSGEIVAMVGGLDYDAPGNGQVNVAVRPRQSGSAFKPVVYAAALDSGWTPAHLLWDIPFEFAGSGGEPYRPQNYDGRYRGPLRLRHALANSLNAATIGLAAELGLPLVHETASAMGLDLGPDPSAHGLSVALGGVDVPLVDLTGVYATLAAGGTHARPNPILAVETFRGGDILATSADPRDQVVSRETAWLLTNVLSDAEARRDAFGEAPALRTSVNAAVKTGTTNDFRDNLTVGYTPYVAVGVWTGNKDGRPMRDVLGITGAAPIWHDAIEHIAADARLLTVLGDGRIPSPDFPPPETVVQTQVCELSTLGVDGTCTRRNEFVPAAAISDMRALAYGWFTAENGCSQPASYRAPGSSLLLKSLTRADLATQVAAYARGRGVGVTVPCGAGVQPAQSGVPDGDPRP
jgi:penicillin-binding protein 1C